MTAAGDLLGAIVSLLGLGLICWALWHGRKVLGGHESMENIGRSVLFDVMFWTGCVLVCVGRLP